MIGVEVAVHFNINGVRKEVPIECVSTVETTDLEVAAEVLRVVALRLARELEARHKDH